MPFRVLKLSDGCQINSRTTRIEEKYLVFEFCERWRVFKLDNLLSLESKASALDETRGVAWGDEKEVPTGSKTWANFYSASVLLFKKKSFKYSLIISLRSLLRFINH